MANISAVADICAVHVHGNSDGARKDDGLATLENIFRAAHSDSKLPEERASKRRKLSHGRSIGLQALDTFDESRSVVLAKVSLDMISATAEDRSRLESIENSNPLVVSFESVRLDSENGFTFTLFGTHLSTTNNHPASGLAIVATTTPQALKTIAPHLQIIADLATTKNGKERASKPGVGFSRCLLTLDPRQNVLRLQAEIRWLVGISVIETLGQTTPYGKRDLNILSKYMPAEPGQTNSPWALSDFYDSVYVPPDDAEVHSRVQKSLLETTLYPFQQRAVEWLLRREGVTYTASGHLQSVDVPSSYCPVSFRSTQDANGKSCHVSHMRGMVVSDKTSIFDSIHALRGGILAEEMGLGKTVELIALMSHNKRPSSGDDVFDDYTRAFVKQSDATLIITPPSILEHWRNEIRAHAPELKVHHYTGIPAASAPKREHEAATVEYLMQFDIVLTTYSVLSREVHFAKPPPDRTLRRERQHERRKSPLVQISWWRVCLDEAQMVESGVSQAAVVARIIPRCNAWAVSGTPLRKDVQDLRGLLTFLRYEPFASCKAVWNRLDKSAFRTIFSSIALRHSKEKVRDELRLPPQRRMVITVPFTAIEEQNYSEMIRQMCDACSLDPEGQPTREDRDATHPEVIERMREWLVRLRQTCLHAHVGRKNRRALGAKNGPIRTVHEVLEIMIEQNDTALKAEVREFILAQIKSGHVKGNEKSDEKRSEGALPFYKQALKDAQGYVQTSREELALEQEKVGIATIELDQDDEEEEKEGLNLGRIPVIRKSLRSFLELEHACKFFIGTVYYQVKSNESLTTPDTEEFHRLEKLEIEWYDEAKKIRRELLRESQSRAQRQMHKISSRRPFYHIPLIVDLPDLGGIETKKILDMMDEVSDLLNEQATQLEKWRQKVVDILLLPLVDEDEGKETTGDEYEDSTKVQDELYIYIMALRTIVADRNAAVNGLKDVLIEHELKEAEKQAKDEEGPKGHAPELVLEVVQTHKKLKPKDELGSLKAVVATTRSLLTSLQWKAEGGDHRARVEHEVVQRYLTQIQRVATEQGKVILELEKEQELFRTAMNHRLEFYRQLQHISDSVAPWREELDETFDEKEFERQHARQEKSKQVIAGFKTKYNYLCNLRQENAQLDIKHDCIICQDEFEIGVLTSCGHKYCKDCITHWWHAHRTCPLCKIRLHTSDFKDINFKPGAITAQEEKGDGSPSQPATPSSSGTSIYSEISDATMKEIKTIDLDGSYGTKVDMIARHLLWIRNNDPGAKSIIFSQFGDFLDVLAEALRRWKIGSSSIDDKNGITNFRCDPAVECFLLDAKSDSSGLNLVDATYVFLCEPLINPAIELQAIARVHRIGQQRPTSVFMYLVGDTVEEAIYDISVARRLAHMGRGPKSRSGTATPVLQEKMIEAANSMELEAAPLKQLLRKKGDGEIVQVDDLWNCLFGKPRKAQRGVLEGEVARQLRADAAEERMAQGVDGSGLVHRGQQRHERVGEGGC